MELSDVHMIYFLDKDGTPISINKLQLSTINKIHNIEQFSLDYQK